jgi:hypothetical protein
MTWGKTRTYSEVRTQKRAEVEGQVEVSTKKQKKE